MSIQESVKFSVSKHLFRIELSFSISIPFALAHRTSLPNQIADLTCVSAETIRFRRCVPH